MSGFTTPTAREQYQLARFDIGYAFLDELNRLGYAKPDTAGLVTAGQHGVNAAYLREMGALGDGGYRGLPLDQVVRVRDHGITPDYISGMRQLGYTLTIEDLVRARDHGVDTQYVRDMAALGFGSTPIERLIAARDHGVTPAYAKELKALGYDSLTLDDLVVLRDHGVTPDRVRSANARAGSRLPIDMLRSLADSGGLR